MDDPPAAVLQSLFGGKQNIASERVDCLVALNSLILRVAESLIPEPSDENPLQRSRPPLEFRQSVLVGVIPLIFATDGRLDLVAGVDNRLQHVNEVAPVVLPRDAESDWLAADLDTRKELCQPYPKDDLDAYEISTRVNNPGNDDPEVIEPLDHEQSGLGEFSS